MAIFNSYVSLPEGMFKWWQLGKKTGYPFAKSKCQFRRENDDEPMGLEGSFFLTNPYQLQEQWKFWREIMETTNQKQQFWRWFCPILPNPKHIFLVKLASEAARTYRDSSNIRALTVYHCHLLTNGCYLSKSENPVACHSSALKLYNYLLWMKV